MNSRILDTIEMMEMSYTDLFLDHGDSDQWILDKLNVIGEVEQWIRSADEYDYANHRGVVLSRFAAYQRGTPNIFDPTWRPSKLWARRKAVTA